MCKCIKIYKNTSTFSALTVLYSHHCCLVPEHFPGCFITAQESGWSPLSSVSRPSHVLCPQLFIQSCCLLVRLVPMLSRYSDLVLFFLTMSLATHRSTAKLLSVLTQVFTELAQKVRVVHVVHCGAAGPFCTQ